MLSVPVVDRLTLKYRMTLHQEHSGLFALTMGLGAGVAFNMHSPRYYELRSRYHMYNLHSSLAIYTFYTANVFIIYFNFH